MSKDESNFITDTLEVLDGLHPGPTDSLAAYVEVWGPVRGKSLYERETALHDRLLQELAAEVGEVLTELTPGPLRAAVLGRTRTGHGTIVVDPTVNVIEQLSKGGRLFHWPVAPWAREPKS
jgi:hypothetical protein